MATVRQADLKNCQRITLSLPKQLVSRLYKEVPKSKRSAYVAQTLELSFAKKLENVESRDLFWEDFWKRNPPEKTAKSVVELIREDRDSH